MADRRSSVVELGGLVRQHREQKGMTVEELCQAIGGTPGPAFLARMEEGSIGPTSSLVLKVAAVLGMSGDLMLNAAGYATEAQRAEALEALTTLGPRRRPTDA